MRIDMETRTPAAKQPRRAGFDLLLTLPFLGLFLVQVAHHQMWRDELNAFGIAVASATPRTLFHYVHYEGHPWLWYGLLWLVSKLTVFPVGLKVLEAAIGTGTYLLIGLASPFRWWEKVLLFLNYFVCFEYSVMARMYSLVLLLVLAYLWQASRFPKRVVFSYGILGLMAMCDLTGIVISVALVLQRAVREKGWQDAFAGNAEGRRLWAGPGTYVLLLLLAIWSLWPARDISTRTTEPPFRSAASVRHLWEAVENYTVMPYFPTATANPKTYWDPVVGLHRHKAPFALALVLLTYWLTLRRRPDLLVLVGAALVMMIGFGHLIYMGGMRHFGVTFVAFLAALWFLRSAGEPVSMWAYVLLACGAVGGIDVQHEEWQRPFSNAQATAAWLRNHPVGQLPLTGTADTSVAGVAEYLHRPIYMLECQCTSTFLLFSRGRDRFTEADIPVRLAGAAQALKTPDFLFLDTAPLDAEQLRELNQQHLVIEPLAAFQGAEAWPEDFWLYRVHAHA
jgi:hypothetical protein